MSGSLDQDVQTNLATVRTLFAAVAGRGDKANFAERWAAYVALYDEDVVIHEAQSLPYGGDYGGKAGVAAHAQEYEATWAPLQDRELQDLQPTFLAAGDRVAVLWRQRGLNARTGERFDMPCTSIYLMRAGRVLESRMFHFDVAAVRAFLDRAREGTSDTKAA